MKKIKFKKILLCLMLISILSISTASARKMFGSTCGYSIDANSDGECIIKITKITYVFWVGIESDGGTFLCDWGLTVEQLCS